jgi:hypothetical protein
MDRKNTDKRREESMKKLIATFLLLGSLSSQAAVNLVCSQEYGDNGDIMPSAHGFVYGSLYTDCRDKNNNSYSITLKGVGPGLELHTTSGFVVTCPTVSKKRLDRKGVINLGSTQISATAIGGVSAGLAVNFLGGSCFIGGIQYGFGASMKVGLFKLMKGSLRENNIKGAELGYH